MIPGKPMTKPDRFDDNPLLDDDFFARARPAREVLSPEVIAAFKAKGGRPKAEAPKESISIRLDPDVVAFYRATGPGWQTRINGDLRQAMRRGSREPRKAG